MPVSNPNPELTARELQVLKLMCADKSNRQIADKLGISIDSVKFHNKNIYKKLNCRSVLAVYKYALREGIVKPPQRRV